jgi:hypothetical protein
MHSHKIGLFAKQYQIASVTRIMDEYVDSRALFKND